MTQIDLLLRMQNPSQSLTGADESGGMISLRRRPVDAVWRTMKRAVEAYARWRISRQTARALSALDDNMLKDLGLTRSDLGAYGGDDDIRRWHTIHRWR
jgi:uncharacterized protein YjiS (DUF1127 family)